MVKVFFSKPHSIIIQQYDVKLSLNNDTFLLKPVFVLLQSHS